MSKKKTIFITSFHGLVSRVLESGLVEHLVKSGEVRLVIFGPDFKVDYFRHLFGHYPNVKIEGVGKILNRWTLLLHQLTFPLLNTKTMYLKRRSGRDFTSWPRFLLNQGVASVLGRWRLVRSLFRWLNSFLAREPGVARYFKTYQPDLVVAMDVKHILDAQFIIEAKRYGVRTLGMVRSWDYLTSKGVVRVQPDKMIVHNEIIKTETIRYADMRPEDIVVVGVPHFDLYVNTKRSSRADFFKQIGVSSTKRLIFFGSVGQKFGASDIQIFELLDQAIHQGILPADLVILVRLPPNDVLSREALLCREHFIFEYPGVPFSAHNRKENEMSFADLTHLADSIYHSELVITGPSTICIDAAVFDKPIICLGFEGDTKRPYFESIIHRYDFDHMQHFVRCQATDIVTSTGELFSAIKQNLEQPERQRAGRARVVTEQCWRLDGQASQRLAEAVLRQLQF